MYEKVKESFTAEVLNKINVLHRHDLSLATVARKRNCFWPTLTMQYPLLKDKMIINAKQEISSCVECAE